MTNVVLTGEAEDLISKYRARNVGGDFKDSNNQEQLFLARQDGLEFAKDCKEESVRILSVLAYIRSNKPGVYEAWSQGDYA
jgi:hypothetical protein